MINHNEDDTSCANVTVDKQGKGVEKQKQYFSFKSTDERWAKINYMYT